MLILVIVIICLLSSLLIIFAFGSILASILAVLMILIRLDMRMGIVRQMLS